MWQLIRGLLRRPAYAAAVTLVLGAGLGGAWCLYGVVDAVLFRPLEVAEADRLVRLFSTDEQRSERDNWSWAGVRDQLAPVDAFRSVAFFADFARLTYAEGDRQHEWNGAVVSGNYFATLGVQPLAGRLFTGDDAVRGAAPVAVLSAETWRNRFAAGESVIGRAIRISGRSVTVVGVAPPRFSGVSLETRVDVWLPMALADMALSGFSLDMRELPNATLFEAATLEGRIDDLTARDRAITTVAAASAVFATLLSVVGMYGIAAFSVRHRRREVGIRYSLGATRSNVVLRFLRRGALVAAAGILLGSVLALLLGPRFAATMTGVDGRPVSELLFVAVLLAAIAVLANVVPVWRAASVAPMEVLRDE